MANTLRRTRTTVSAWGVCTAILLPAAWLFSGTERLAAQPPIAVTGPTGSTGTAGAKPGAGKDTTAGRPVDYRSQHFLLHSDLNAADAKELLTRLETMLELISKYWTRPPVGIIECYVVKDPRNWEGVPIDPQGWQSIEAGAGVTIGNGFTQGDKVMMKATVYAVADHGTPQHEAVHAYCYQAFGRAGPTWYAEGMAEMGQYWKAGDKTVNAHELVVDYIRKSTPKSLNSIVNGKEKTGDSWQNYAWRWALCHVLANNPNYAAKFHPLGMSMLTEKGNLTFENVYGDMAEEISFEYLFFLQHVERGFRADLTSFDWKRKFVRATSSGLACVCDAGRGWQPSGVMLEKDMEYVVTATGTWKLAADGKPLPAAGEEDGKGRLVGMILKDWKISETFEIGGKESFVAPADGNLWVRCNDAWVEIADNKGKINLRLKPKK